MISICKRFEFDAAHHLPLYFGKCHNIHGHHYFLDVEVTGALFNDGPSAGMIVDFGDLKTVVNRVIIDRFDHTDLNVSCPVYPTAERMVAWIANELLMSFTEIGVSLLRVRLYETPTAYAEWRA